MDHRNFTLTGPQHELFKLYQLHKKPIFGTRRASGTLSVGLNNEPMPNVPFTKENLADHFQYYERLRRFYTRCSETGVTDIPPEVSIGADDAVRRNFDKDLAYPLRQYLVNRGVEGVTCWFYVCRHIEAWVNEDSGLVEFKYSHENPMAIIPMSLNEALKRWTLSNEEINELAVLAGWFIFFKLPSINVAMTEPQARNLFREFSEALPDKDIYDYLTRNMSGERGKHTFGDT